jgi:phage terminase large subunit GpA-like protein
MIAGPLGFPSWLRPPPMAEQQLLIGNGERYTLRTFALALRPAPPVDLVAWARSHVRFGPGSPFPGAFDPELLPFFQRILEVLSPDDPARIVSLVGSAQVGKTVVAEIFTAASLDLDPGPFLYVHPTEDNAVRWARTKWRPLTRGIGRLGEIFDLKQSKEGGNSTLYQERRDGRGFLLISGASSEASLSMISVSRQVQDDLAKWTTNDAGDPEYQAENRSKAFEWAKILKLSTPLLADSCRITRAFKAGTQEHWHVPCPHCGHKHPLEPENFIAHLDEEHPERAGFYCPGCGSLIEQKHRRDIVARGEWVADNPKAVDPSFSIWAAYAPFESWERIARSYLSAKGDPAAEQTWWNDTAGRAYEQPGEAPAWEELKARAETGQRLRGIVPIGALLLTLTLDCQDDYIDGAVTGWGSNLRRWVVERIRVEGHISTPETRAELAQLVDKAWPTALNTKRRVDLTGIDANAWTDDVFDWAKTFPKSRVVMVRGAAGDAAPSLALVRKERRRDGKIVKYQGRFFNVGVNGLKAGLYKFLRIEDKDQRGFVDFPAGLEDDYYEQLTAEKRTAVIDRKGFTVHQWIKSRSQRNEMLDCAVYAEALAGKIGWRTFTPAQWAAIEAEREVAAAPVSAQSDLFAAPVIPSPASTETSAQVAPPAPRSPEKAPPVPGWIRRFADRQLG